MTRAALYARISTPDQHPELQLEELRQVAAQRGWEVVAELVDVGSGARADLPNRAQARDLAHRGEIDVLAVWKLDRLGRSVADLVEIVAALERAGVELVTIRDAIDTGTPAGRMVFHVLAAVAELERELIRERVVAGLERAKRQGTQLGRPKVPVALTRARGLLAQGKSLRKVARLLGVSRRTLGRALEQAGVGQKPGSDDGREVPEIMEPERDPEGRSTNR